MWAAKVRFGMVRCGSVWYGSVWFGMVNAHVSNAYIGFKIRHEPYAPVGPGTVVVRSGGAR